MSRTVFAALLASTFLTLPAFSQPLSLDADTYSAAAPRPSSVTCISRPSSE